LWISVECTWEKAQAGCINAKRISDGMIEFYGWCAIAPSCGAGSNRSKDQTILRRLTPLVDQLNREESVAGLRSLNGQTQLFVMGGDSSKGRLWADIHGMYEWIAENAADSYGMLQLQDDLDPDGFENAFQTFVLKHGTFERRMDRFLSPRNPGLAPWPAEL
jgi:hypothetical protein